MRGDSGWWTVWLGVLVAFVLPWAATAQDDEDDILVEDDEFEEVRADSLKVYRAFKEALAGMDGLEEIEAWYNYLDEYPETAYRAEIERRIDQLEGEALDEAEIDAPEYTSAEEDGRGAKYEEIPFVEPFNFLGPNTRSRVHLAIAYGATSTFNYDLGVEYAIRRNFSVYGHARHWGHGIGFGAHLGAKYALVKDTRTGGLVVVGATFEAGADPKLLVGVDPYVGIGVCPLGAPVNLQLVLGFDMRFTPWHWDAHAGLNLAFKPSNTVHIFVEGTGHNHVAKMLAYDAAPGETCGDDGAGDADCTSEYFGFYEAAAGVKVYPRENIEISIAARAPFFYRKWQHYTPAGGGVNVLVYF